MEFIFDTIKFLKKYIQSIVGHDNTEICYNCYFLYFDRANCSLWNKVFMVVSIDIAG